MREAFQFHCLAIPDTGQHVLQAQHQAPQLKLQQFQPHPTKKNKGYFWRAISQQKDMYNSSQE